MRWSRHRIQSRTLRSTSPEAAETLATAITDPARAAALGRLGSRRCRRAARARERRKAVTRSRAQGTLAIIRPMTPPDDATDEQLMHRYVAGDAHAFEQLYDRHGVRLWRYIFRSVRDTATADELAQDVWLRVARNAARYQPRAGAGGQPMARLSTWLFTVARHRVVDHLRAARPTASLDDAVDDEHTLADTLAAPSGFGPVRRIESRQQARQLLAALEQLPAAQRDSFLLQAEGEMSVAEIAAATGVGIETAKSRLRYARAALRRTLENMA